LYKKNLKKKNHSRISQKMHTYAQLQHLKHELTFGGIVYPHQLDHDICPAMGVEI
jgi:hypothetical protein